MKQMELIPGGSAGLAMNAEQRRAVQHGAGPVLVLAGAGTGKTRVIIERIRLLLENDPSLSGENILGLTFTDKAAAEMKYRVEKSAGERAEGVWLSTFHRFCLEKILQSNDSKIQALDELDHRILLRRNIGELELAHFKRLQEPGEFLQDFVSFFGRCQDELVTPDDYQRYVEGLRQKHDSLQKNAGSRMEPDALKIAEEMLGRQEELARVYRTSTRLLGEKNLCTFGVQIMKAVQSLQADAGLLARVRQQYRYILVDEFQDTNIAQLELLWLLSGERGNIMVVGDPNQAIYRFRGASYGSFTIFLKRFCGVKEAKLGPATREFLVSLSQNYRSTKKILKVADVVIRNNDQSPLLPLDPLRTDNREGEKIRVVEFGDVEQEAQWVISEVERLHAAGASWDSFAILYRIHAHCEQMVKALRCCGIPFTIRNFSILSSTLVRDLLAWMKLTGRPADNISCARALAAPYWGLEPRDLVRLAQRAAKNHGRPLADELETAQADEAFRAKGARLAEFVQLMTKLRVSAKQTTASEFLAELARELAIAPLPTQEDREYFARFAEFVREWESRNEGKQLRDFLEYLVYFDEANGDIKMKDGPSTDAVQLMTSHSAKGLEFPHVFVLRLSKNDFPSKPRAVKFEFPEELMKEERPRGDFHYEEERRLFYVSLTRAEKNLTISTIVHKRKQQSPFLDDFLQDSKIQRFDVAQSSPKVKVPLLEDAVPATDDPEGPGKLFASAATSSKVYSHIALWAKAYHPPIPEPLQLSASSIDTYSNCGMKYMFAYLWKITRGPNPMMTFGRVMHSTIREFISEMRKGRKIPFDEVLAIYDREWSSAGFPDDYHEQEYRNAGREQLEAFYNAYSAAPADVLYQEKAFELPLEHDVVLTGRMDQVNRLADDSIEIVDYKTGRLKDQKTADRSVQLGVYALAAKELLDAMPGRLCFHYLMANETVSTTRDAKALTAVKQKILEVADQIRAGEFSAKKNFLCKSCEYKPLCPAHEDLISIRPAPAAPAIRSGKDVN